MVICNAIQYTVKKIRYFNVNLPYVLRFLSVACHLRSFNLIFLNGYSPSTTCVNGNARAQSRVRRHIAPRLCVLMEPVVLVAQ